MNTNENAPAAVGSTGLAGVAGSAAFAPGTRFRLHPYGERVIVRCWEDATYRGAPLAMAAHAPEGAASGDEVFTPVCLLEEDLERGFLELLSNIKVCHDVR